MAAGAAAHGAVVHSLRLARFGALRSTPARSQVVPSLAVLLLLPLSARSALALAAAIQQRIAIGQTASSALSWQRYGTTRRARAGQLLAVCKDTSSYMYILQGQVRAAHDDDSHTFISATHADKSMKMTTNVTSNGPWGSPHSGWSYATAEGDLHW